LWRSLPAPSLAYGSRGSELRGLALLNIASYNTGSLRDMVLWNDGMFHRADEQIARTTLYGTKVHAHGVQRYTRMG